MFDNLKKLFQRIVSKNTHIERVFNTESDVIQSNKHIIDKLDKPVFTESPSLSLQDHDLPDIPNIIWEAELGKNKGYFSNVYKVLYKKTDDKSQDIYLAVKRVKTEKISEVGGIRIFLIECQHWIDLDPHLNIVNCYYVRIIQEIPYIFMEYIHEGSIDDWIVKERISNLSLLLLFAYQIALGIHYIHNKNIIHQDIKPANILVEIIGDSPTAKISDFTISAKTDEHGYGLRRGGSVPFASPEQLSDTKYITYKSDIWNWAATVLQMFTKTIIWTQGKQADVLDMYYHHAPSHPHWLPMSQPVYDLLHNCFQDDPQARPENMQVIAERLKVIYQQETGTPLPEMTINAELLNAINYNNKGVSYWNIGSFNEALLAFDKAIDCDPSYLTALFNLSIIRWSLGIIPDDFSIIKMLENYLGNSDEDWYVYYLLGRIYLYSRQAEKAREALQKSYDLNPDYMPTIRFLNELEEKFALYPHEITELEGHTDSVLCLDISKDEKKVISGSWDKTIRIWDIEKNSCLGILEGHEEHVSAVSFSSCGSFAVSGDTKGIIRYWDLQKKECTSIMEIEEKEGENIGIGCIAFLPDNNLIISGDKFNKEAHLRIWNIKTSGCIRILKGHRKGINSIVISSPDGKYIITSGDDNTVKIWDLNTFDCTASFVGNTKYAETVEDGFRHEKEYISFADIKESNDYILTANSDSSINLYDVSSEKILKTFHGHSERVNCVRWIQNTDFAISTSTGRTWDTGEIKIWDIKHRTCLSTFQATTGNKVFAFAHNCKKLVFANSNNIHVWRIGDISSIRPALIIDKIEKATEQIDTSYQIKDRISQIEKHISRKEWEHGYILLKEIKQNYKDFKKHSHIRELSSRISEGAERNGIEEIWVEGTITWKDKAFGSNISCLDILNDSNTIIAASHDGIIFISDIKSKRIFSILHSNDNTNCIKFIDNNRALSGGKDVVKLWDLNKLERISDYSFDKVVSGINALDYLKDSDLALIGIGGLHKSLTLYNISIGEPICEFEDDSKAPLFGGGICFVRFSSNGHHALAGNHEGTIKLWDLHERELVLTLKGHSDSVVFVCFCKSDTTAVSVSSDNTIRVWDLTFGRCIKVIQCSSGNIKSACITNDESYLITLDENSSINLWNLSTYNCDYTYTNIQSKLSEIAVTDDSKYIVAGGQDRTINIFGIEWTYEFKKDETVTSSITKGSRDRTLILPNQSEIQPFLNIGHTSDISTLTVVGFKHLLSGSFDNTIKIWDLMANGICTNTLVGHTGVINAIVLTPDKEKIISGSSDANVIVWNFNSGSIKYVVAHGSPVNTIAITSDQKYLVSGSEDGTIKIWDFDTRNIIRTLELRSSVSSILITSNNEYLIAGTKEGNTNIWDFKSFDQVKVLIDNSSGISKIIQSADNQHVYIGNEIGEIEIIELATFNTVRRISTNTKRMSDFCFAGKELITCNFNFNWSSVTIRDSETGETKKEIKNIGWTRTLTPYPFGHFFIGLSRGHILMVSASTGEFAGLLSGQDDNVWCVKISQNKRYIISGYYNCFRIFDLHTGKLTEFKNDHNIVDVDFLSDNQYAFAEEYSGIVYQIDLNSQQIIKEYRFPHLGNLNSITGTAGSSDKFAVEYDIIFMIARDETGIFYFREIKKDEIEANQDSDLVNHLNKSNIRYMLLNKLLNSSSFSSLNEVILIDMYKKGEQINFKFKTDDYDHKIQSVFISYDNKHLISKDYNGTIKIWDINTQKLIRTIEDEEKEYNINTIIGYNDNIMMAGCNNGKIKLWNINTGRQIISFAAHQCPVSCLSISGDRRLIVSGGKSDGIKIWSFGTFELVASLTMLNKTDFVVYTPNKDFYLSDPKFLQFFEVKKSDDNIERILISNEETRKDYLNYFVDIHRIKESLNTQ